MDEIKSKNIRLKESTIMNLKLEAVKQKTNDSRLAERYIIEGLKRDGYDMDD